MRILRPEFATAVLLACSVPAVAASPVNPLGGETQDAQENSFGPVDVPRSSLGKLEPDKASGGVIFSDEAGWYRFTMANGGTTEVDGALRTFAFESGGQNAVCFAVRSPESSFAKFSMEQIQAELDTLYTPFDPTILANGVTILARKSITLDATGQTSVVPLRVLAWDTRDSEGNLMTYALAPLPAGQLMFACAVGSSDHAREIIQRYFRIAKAGTIAAK